MYGNRIVIGVDGSGYNYGYAYVYEYDSINKEWKGIIKLEPNNHDAGISDQFGAQVAINDKFIAVCSQPSSDIGNVYIFEFINGTWNQTLKINGFIDSFGESLTMNNNMNIEDNFSFNNKSFIVVGAPGGSTAAGNVYIYEYDSINQRWDDTYTYA